MPVRRIKIFNRFEFKSGDVDFLFNRGKFLVSPELVRVAGQTPAGVVTDRLIAGLIAARGAEIIHEMNNEVRAAALPGETIMLGVELMAIKSESEFHLENYYGFKARSKTPF